MDVSRLLQDIMERLSEPTAVLDGNGDVVCANKRFRALYNPLSDPSKTKPCEELLGLNRRILDSAQPTAFERLVLGPLQKTFDVFMYSLDAPGQNRGRTFVLVKEESDARDRKLEMSEELMNSFTSAWKVFSERLGPEFHAIKGEDVSLRLALLNAQKAAKTNLPILIVGESGTGKELLAQAIHRSSPRNGGPFVDVNCAAIPESLIESELFGYERGAFTGARREGKKGLFDQADGGTIFLDEIGDASFAVQSKLLRVLQGGEFMRVGGTTNVAIDVRIISATNKELASIVRQTRFRDDLYYRLNTVTITLPPLKKRGSDIRLLAASFLEEHSAKKGLPLSFSEQTMRLMESFPWPGNIRELKSVVDYAATMSMQQEIQPESLPVSMFLERSFARKEKNVTEVLESGFSDRHFLPAVVRDVERTFIERAIRISSTRSEAIRLLGISRRTFYKKIKEYQLDVERLR